MLRILQFKRMFSRITTLLKPTQQLTIRNCIVSDYASGRIIPCDCCRNLHDDDDNLDESFCNNSYMVFDDKFYDNPKNHKTDEKNENLFN